MRYLLSLLLITVLLSPAQALKDLSYELSMPQPHTHYFEVRMEVNDVTGDQLDYKLPVWAPGSYLVREFARHVEGFRVQDGNGRDLDWIKTDKSTWRVTTTGSSRVIVYYRVYAYELSVRTSFIDASHGYVNGTSVFMYLDGQLNMPSQLTVIPHPEWQRVSTGLKLKSSTNRRWVYEVPDYDILGDCPIEIGNHEVVSFKAAGVEHQVAMYGESNYDKETIIADLTKVVEGCTDVFGENPNDNYVFIIHNTGSGGGGLEHLNSTTLHVNRWTYSNARPYTGFLSLATHEYFHLWNVKRLRPAALGPFNYEAENYTRLLWVMEGFTSYYDEYLLVGMGFVKSDYYLSRLASGISTTENQPGSKVQPVSEASFDAWIKAYRPHENSYNTTISYYTKGSVLAALLNLEILHSTKGQKDLDDVMQLLYNRYYKQQNRGFTDAEMKAATEEVAGRNLDNFFERYVHSVDRPNYEKYLGYAGLVLNTSLRSSKPRLGVSMSSRNGKLTVTRVNRGTTAYDGGVNVDDEIIAVDGYRTASSDDLSKYLDMKKVGDEVTLTLSRDGVLMELNLILAAGQGMRYSIDKMENPTEEQKAVYQAWLGKWE